MPSPPAKRRLPVLQNVSDDPVRPAWQWVAFGALAIVAVWVPLSALVGAIAARQFTGPADSSASRLAVWIISAAYLVELALGAFAGGYLVGKWGPPNVGVRQAALAGATSATALAVFTWVSFGATFGLLLLFLIAPPAAALGGRIGTKNR